MHEEPKHYKKNDGIRILLQINPKEASNSEFFFSILAKNV